LKIESQPREDQQIELTVEFEPATLEDFKRRAAKRLANRVKIPGFRPGKAPYNVVVRQIGDGAILEEALDILVDDQYPKVIEESGIKPYGPGSLEKIVSMDPPVLQFVVPLQAEVTLGDYKSIRQLYEAPRVAETEVESVIDDLRGQRAILEPVDRPVQESDVVTAKLSASRTEVEEGESASLINEMSSPFLIEKAGASREDEWPFQGFSERFIGLTVGAVSDFEYTYPDTSPYEMLKDTACNFHFEVEEIKARNLPTLDDDFAASVGEFASVEALLDRIRTNLALDKLNHYHDDYDQKILEELVAQTDFKYPPQMLEDEIDSVVNNLKSRLENQNQDLDLYLKARGMDMDALREESRPVAETRLKNTLALLELAKAEDIKIDEKAFEAEASQTLASLMQSLSEKEARRLFSQPVYGNLMNNIMANMLTARSYDTLRNIASEGASDLALAAVRPAAEETDDTDSSDDEINSEMAEAVPSEEDATIVINGEEE